MSDAIDTRRRGLLIGASVSAAAAALGTFRPVDAAEAGKQKVLPGYADWKDRDDLIVHSANTIETRRDAFGSSLITPDDMLFVRNNLPPPDPSVLENRDAWQLTVEGVGNSKTLTLGELKRVGIETVAMALQCSGNGRGFFDHKASGTQWRTGAAGCVMWSGVPVAELAKSLGGIAHGMQFITGTGGEPLPQGIDPKQVVVERSVPIKALEQALLAWEMNGEPLSLAHGGPLRLIVPGYYGVNNVKYVKRLAFTPKESDAAIQATGYRVRPIGEKGAPSQPSMWEMNVKSWVQHPAPEADRLASGMVQIYGVAFAGTESVKRVEVSLDGGQSWREARFLGPDLGRYAWRQFVFPARLDTGRYEIASKATDARGRVQPEGRLENERGYGHNGWRDHAVHVTVG
jgi:DMSO/TMAO reductase YedYZ molybdopterin-dependent catalytic subunit